MINKASLDSLCAALAYAMGVEAPACAAKANADLCGYIDRELKGQKADRIFMYNPDAIGQWIYEKYPQLFFEAKDRCALELPLCTVMPSVTPVCFATMYTGAQPPVHGIQKYEKPTIQIDTIFDALIRANKKPVIVAYASASLGKIFLGRNMDYFIYDDIDQVNAKAAEIIVKDEYDFVVVYNGNYDSAMHKNGPESVVALSELRSNIHSFATFYEMIKQHWKKHNTLLGFAMDHGCHEIDENCGSHGLDMEEDLNITHLYKILKADK